MPQDHDNDHRDIADEAEDCVNMWEVELSHGNLCDQQLQFEQDQKRILDTCSNACVQMMEDAI